MATKDDVVTIKFDINSLQWKVIDELREQTKYKSEKKHVNRHPRNKIAGWLVNPLFSASESTLEALAKDVENAIGAKVTALDCKRENQGSRLHVKEQTAYRGLKGQLDVVQGLIGARKAAEETLKPLTKKQALAMASRAELEAALAALKD